MFFRSYSHHHPCLIPSSSLSTWEPLAVAIPQIQAMRPTRPSFLRRKARIRFRTGEITIAEAADCSGPWPGSHRRPFRTTIWLVADDRMSNQCVWHFAQRNGIAFMSQQKAINTSAYVSPRRLWANRCWESLPTCPSWSLSRFGAQTFSSYSCGKSPKSALLAIRLSHNFLTFQRLI